MIPFPMLRATCSQGAPEAACKLPNFHARATFSPVTLFLGASYLHVLCSCLHRHLAR